LHIGVFGAIKKPVFGNRVSGTDFHSGEPSKKRRDRAKKAGKILSRRENDLSNGEPGTEAKREGEERALGKRRGCPSRESGDQERSGAGRSGKSRRRDIFQQGERDRGRGEGCR